MMQSDHRKELQEGFNTAFIDWTTQSSLAYRPEFLSNDYGKGRKVLVSIERELILCDEFKISVAFITKSGITPLLETLKELEQKGIPGQILTTDYLNFSEPEALEKLASLSNIELRMFRTNGETAGFHTKGYIFRQEEIYSVSLTREEEIVVEFLSKKLVSYKRIHDLALLKQLVAQQDRLLIYYKELLNREYNVELSAETEESVFRNLTNEFPKEEEKKKYAPCVFIERGSDGSYNLTNEFKKMLTTKDFKKMVMELLTFGIERYKENYSNTYRDTSFQLYQKYNYEDVCRLLNWKKNMNAQNIGGYFYDSETKTLPVFINYDKAEDAIAYEDRFVSENVLIALSKHPRKITSGDAIHIYKKGEQDKDNRIFLFVRKNKDDNEAKEFYFLGEMNAEGEPHQIRMETTKDDAFEITYRLDVPVRSDIYDYIVRD